MSRESGGTARVTTKAVNVNTVAVLVALTIVCLMAANMYFIARGHTGSTSGSSCAVAGGIMIVYTVWTLVLGVMIALCVWLRCRSKRLSAFLPPLLHNWGFRSPALIGIVCLILLSSSAHHCPDSRGVRVCAVDVTVWLLLAVVGAVRSWHVTTLFPHTMMSSSHHWNKGSVPAVAKAGTDSDALVMVKLEEGEQAARDPRTKSGVRGEGDQQSLTGVMMGASITQATTTAGEPVVEQREDTSTNLRPFTSDEVTVLLDGCGNGSVVDHVLVDGVSEVKTASTRRLSKRHSERSAAVRGSRGGSPSLYSAEGVDDADVDTARLSTSRRSMHWDDYISQPRPSGSLGDDELSIVDSHGGHSSVSGEHPTQWRRGSEENSVNLLPRHSVNTTIDGMGVVWSPRGLTTLPSTLTALPEDLAAHMARVQDADMHSEVSSYSEDDSREEDEEDGDEDEKHIMPVSRPHDISALVSMVNLLPTSSKRVSSSPAKKKKHRSAAAGKLSTSKRGGVGRARSPRPKSRLSRTHGRSRSRSRSPRLAGTVEAGLATGDLPVFATPVHQPSQEPELQVDGDGVAPRAYTPGLGLARSPTRAIVRTALTGYAYDPLTDTGSVVSSLEPPEAAGKY